MAPVLFSYDGLLKDNNYTFVTSSQIFFHLRIPQEFKIRSSR